MIITAQFICILYKYKLTIKFRWVKDAKTQAQSNFSTVDIVNISLKIN